MSWYDYPYYKPSTPRKARGGIKSQSKRGTFGESWWAKRWIQVLESFNIGARLGRGRRYARSGQVLTIEIEKGKVTASVQGSRMTPYSVDIRLKPLTRNEWKQFINVLNKQPYFTAMLMNGKMPDEIEKVFKKAKLSLFPTRSGDLKTDCSCPDWSNPCKHIAAVYYLLGEEFDRNPFLIFTLRGMERDELLSLINQEVKVTPDKKIADRTSHAKKRKQKAVAGKSLPTDANDFWGKNNDEFEFLGETIVPTMHAALPKRLGSFPFWRGEEKFLSVLEPIYKEATDVGLEIVAGVFGGGRERKMKRSG